MKVYFLVFLFQLFFNIFKTMEIKYTYENKVRALLFNSVWINLISLATTYLSLERIFAGDWLIVVFYIGGSVFGKWLAMTHIENYRQKVYDLFKKNQ